MGLLDREGLWRENAGAVYHAADYRAMMSALLAGKEGLFGPTDFMVEATTPASMDLTVRAGAVGIQATAGSLAGIYLLTSGTLETVTVPASDATNDRNDLVVVTQGDTAGSMADDDTVVVVLEGPADGSLDDPTIPDNSYAVARVFVDALTESLDTADITLLGEAIEVIGGPVLFETSGTFEKADFPGLKQIRVRLVGGGGGGSGQTGSAHFGTGGGGGGYAESVHNVGDLLDVETVTIGAGGAGGAAGANAGTTGGTTSFGALVTATGGGGGNPTNVSPRVGGAGGVGTTGTVLSSGAGGHNGQDNADGAGGASLLGGPGFAANPSGVNSPGQDGVGYGSGGGGGWANGTPDAGGDGAAGVVIVDLFY